MEYLKRTWKSKLIGLFLILLACLAALVAPEDVSGSVLAIILGICAILSPCDITETTKED